MFAFRKTKHKLKATTEKVNLGSGTEEVIHLCAERLMKTQTLCNQQFDSSSESYLGPWHIIIGREKAKQHIQGKET